MDDIAIVKKIVEYEAKFEGPYSRKLVYYAKAYLREQATCSEHNTEWKPLEVDNLPPDILTGDYEFEYYNVDNCLTRESEGWEFCGDKAKSIAILNTAFSKGEKYRYRKRKHEPTVEEMAEKYVDENFVHPDVDCSYTRNQDVHLAKQIFIDGYNQGVESCKE